MTTATTARPDWRDALAGLPREARSAWRRRVQELTSPGCDPSGIEAIERRAYCEV